MVAVLMSCAGGGAGGDDVPTANPEVELADADEVAVGTNIVVADGAELVVVDGPANAFRATPTEGTYLAAVPGTYRVVEHVRVPCGGPPDEDDARTITIVRDGDEPAREEAATAARPSGFLAAGRIPSPRC